ncbi:hypothetical protein ACQ7B2_10780, partial [Escherichia coli]
RGGIHRLAEECSEGGLRTRPVDSGGRPIGVKVGDLALGAQAIEPGGVARSLAFRENSRERVKSLACRGQLPF